MKMEMKVLGILGVLGAAAFLFVLWKLYFFLIWRIEKRLFFRSVRHYLEENKERGKRKCG